jgi:hypothetical protein
MTEAVQELQSHSIQKREIPLSLQIGLKFKFHVLLECGECRTTTLGHNPLQFDPKTQKIVDTNKMDFQHVLRNNIWDMVVKCKRLGDGDMITLLVPFNGATGNFDWETRDTTKKEANL